MAAVQSRGGVQLRRGWQYGGPSRRPIMEKHKDRETQLLELMIPPQTGRVAQRLERPSWIGEVPGSIPGLAFSFSSYSLDAKGWLGKSSAILFVFALCGISAEEMGVVSLSFFVQNKRGIGAE